MTIRSWDVPLGAPFNIAETALFLSIMARLSGYTPATITVQGANIHIYEDQVDAFKTQLERDPLPLANLILSDNIKPIQNLNDIKGVFERIQLEDIWLDNYKSHEVIKMPMSA